MNSEITNNDNYLFVDFLVIVEKTLSNATKHTKCRINTIIIKNYIQKAQPIITLKILKDTI